MKDGVWEIFHTAEARQPFIGVLYRSSHQRCSIIIGVLKNSGKFTRKHLCKSLFSNRVTDLRPATFIKKEALAQVFSSEFCEISKNTFLQNTSGRLLLFVKKLFWKISQDSQGNTCTRVSYEEDTLVQVSFCKFCKIFHKKILNT